MSATNTSPAPSGKGPLSGLRIIEFEGIGPGPFCAMCLADLGADVLLIDRPGESGLGLGRARWYDVMMRGRRSVTLDLKTTQGTTAALQLLSRADACIEGFRPGVMERLGLGPEVVLARNPRLVYGRMTGWGQAGPMAARAGHDINYIALSGALAAIGRHGEAPVAPLNLVGDFGGGGLLLAFGITSALLEAQRAGRGQVVDAAMVEGASLLSAMFHGMLAANRWTEARGVNALDSGAPWYDTYRTQDDQYVAIGAIESKFYAALLQGLGLDTTPLPAQHDRAGWPQLRAAFTAAFASRTRAQWCDIFDGTDACVSPVLTWTEARAHAHMQARESFVEVGGVPQPAPAPRFSRTPNATPTKPPERGEGGAAALRDWGFSAAEIEQLRALGLGTQESTA